MVLLPRSGVLEYFGEKGRRKGFSSRKYDAGPSFSDARDGEAKFQTLPR